MIQPLIERTPNAYWGTEDNPACLIRRNSRSPERIAEMPKRLLGIMNPAKIRSDYSGSVKSAFKPASSELGRGGTPFRRPPIPPLYPEIQESQEVGVKVEIVRRRCRSVFAADDAEVNCFLR